MIDTNDIRNLIGAQADDRDGDKIGKVNQVFVDENTGRPLWASVHTGLFGTSETLVPLENAEWTGDALRIDYEKSFVKDAPNVDASGAITPEEQDRLYEYYSLTGSAGTAGADTTRREGETDTVSRGRDTGTVGRDTSGPETDSAMTRSEEQLHVGTERVQTGRARLRKYIVTEEQTVTVPVTREEVRLEREPITDKNVGDALDGPELSEEEHEVTLSEERVVVDKETVPVERVRLDTDTVTEQQRVDEEVRKERIELDDETKR
jgi:uncharacterized protein (TIGR02271 family)